MSVFTPLKRDLSLTRKTSEWISKQIFQNVVVMNVKNEKRFTIIRTLV